MKWSALLAGRRGLLLLGLAFMLPRLLVCLIPIDYVSDAQWYFARAASLARGEGYVENGIPTAYWPPGWPFVLAGSMRLFGASVAAVVTVNLLASAITGVLTYLLARRIFDSETVGRTAVLLLAVYPNSIGHVANALTEATYTALLLAICWLLMSERRHGTLFGAGVLVGVASLMKAQTVLVVPILFTLAWLAMDQRRSRLLPTAAQGIFVIAVAALVIAPWTYRNFTVFQQLIPISTNGGLTLLTGNNPSAKGDFTPDDPLVTSLHRTVENQVAVDREAKARAMQWIADNPGRFVALMPLKLFRLWAPDGESEWAFQDGFRRYPEFKWAFRAVRVFNQAYYVALLLGFLVGGWLVVKQIRKGQSASALWRLLPYGMALYPSLIALVFSGQSRFHHPVMPYIVMMAAWVLVLGRHREGAAESAMAPSDRAQPAS